MFTGLLAVLIVGTLAWISTERDSPDIGIVKGLTRLSNLLIAIRRIGALKAPVRGVILPGWTSKTVEIVAKGGQRDTAPSGYQNTISHDESAIKLIRKPLSE